MLNIIFGQYIIYLTTKKSAVMVFFFVDKLQLW